MASFTSAISVCLADSDIYAQYYPWMEMLCREQWGKPKTIFPNMAFDITGLESEKKYEVFLSFERHDKSRYTYDKKAKQWKVDGKPKKAHDYKKLSMKIKSGAEWMETPLVVEEARITNNSENDDKKTFFMTPLHKYVPVVFIRDTETSEEIRFEVEKAQFIPVTTLYNKDLANWKATHSKFSTCRNKGPGKPVKRKSTDKGAPEAKRPPLMEQNFQMFSSNPPNFPNNGLGQWTTNWYSYNDSFNYSGYPMAPNFSMNTIYPTGYPDRFPHQTYNENLLPFPTYPTQFTNFY